MFSLFVIYAAGVLSFQIDASIHRRVLSDKGELLAGMEVMLLRSAGDSVPEKYDADVVLNRFPGDRTI